MTYFKSESMIGPCVGTRRRGVAIEATASASTQPYGSLAIVHA